MLDSGLKEKQKYQEMLLLDSATNMDSPNANNNEESRNIELKFFDLGTVINATNNFSPAKKLGQGGYGPVYKVIYFLRVFSVYLLWK